MNLKTIFIGTSEFAVPILMEIIQNDYFELIAVVTQPDRPAGRKQELKPSDVKEFLINNHPDVKIFQPEKIRTEAENILSLNPELIIVASYGQIIPNKLLNYPKYGCLNLHVSLLPKLRGAVPMPMAILQGLKITGVTLQKMIREMDRGAIVSQIKFALQPDETTESLTLKSAEVAAEIIREDIKKFIDGEITPKEQDETQATYCYKEDISKEKAEITSNTNIDLAERMIRAFYPWPIAWVRLENGKVLKIFKAAKTDYRYSDSKLITSEAKKLYLNLQDGSLELLEVQLEGKERRAAKDYLYLSNL